MVLPARTLRRYQEEIGKIRALSDESVDDLVLAFEDAPLTTDAEILASKLSVKVRDVSRDDLEEIVTALLSLCVLRDQFGVSTPEVAENLARALEADEEKRKRLNNRLARLLSLEQLNVVAKSGALQVNHEHFFRDAQIFTDVRPVFGPNPKDSPTAAIITHTLKLTYFKDNEFSDFFIVLDASDISKLSEVLERATWKTESIKSVLDNTEVRYVDAGEERVKGDDGDASS